MNTLHAARPALPDSLSAADPTVTWLLAAATPTIRYLTLTELLDRPVDDSAVEAARAAIRTEGPVPTLLGGQTPAGGWAPEHSYYTPKYVSSHWSMMLLAELRLNAGDEAFRRGARFMLDTTREMLNRRLATNHLGLSCFFGNMLRYALQAGVDDHPQLPAVIAFTVRDLGGGRCQCEHNVGFACGWGVVRTLWGLAALPPALRAPDVAQTIARGIDFLVAEHSLVEGAYPIPADGKIHPIWGRTSFPLFYQGDILFTLRVLAELDALDHPGAQPALAWLAARRRKNGRWRGSSPFRSRTWPVFPVEEVDRWVTLQALSLLRQAQRPL